MNGNSSDDKERLSLEMESSPEPRARSPVDFCQSLLALITAYVGLYRKVVFPIFALVFVMAMVLMLESVASHITARKSHVIVHDYSSIDSLYGLKVAQIDHWCLQGGNTKCRCNDPTEPMSREEARGWLKAHTQNKEKVQALAGVPPDVVFLGDDFIENWNGSVLGLPMSKASKEVHQFFVENFTREGGSMVDGLALGISGDTTANLLWRIQHGELPDSSVFWINIGTNDLGRGQCSEEAVLLGILRLAEEIHEKYPLSVIVINSILPRSSGAIDFFTPIALINEQLQSFCKKHPSDHFVFFDVTPNFVNSPLKHKKLTLREPLYQADHFHLTAQGHKVWGNAILDRLRLLLEEDDEESRH